MCMYIYMIMVMMFISISATGVQILWRKIANNMVHADRKIVKRKIDKSIMYLR